MDALLGLSGLRHNQTKYEHKISNNSEVQMRRKRRL